MVNTKLNDFLNKWEGAIGKVFSGNIKHAQQHVVYVRDGDAAEWVVWMGWKAILYQVRLLPNQSVQRYLMHLVHVTPTMRRGGSAGSE